MLHGVDSQLSNEEFFNRLCNQSAVYSDTILLAATFSEFKSAYEDYKVKFTSNIHVNEIELIDGKIVVELFTHHGIEAVEFDSIDLIIFFLTGRRRG